MLRTGSFPGVKHAFKKVVHVGHSFGAAQTYALANMYPHATDGIVLTGFSMNGSFVGFFQLGANFMIARHNQPVKFGSKGQNLPSGYLLSGDAEADQTLFLLPGRYDPALGALGTVTKQPVTIGELLTLGSAPKINQYAGPVLVFTGGTSRLAIYPHLASAVES